MMLPDKVFAASEGGNTGITIGGYDAERRPFIYVDFTCGAWGGRPWADGLDGNANMFANMASHSVEVTEAEQPIEILAYEFVPDRPGPGKFRGGTPYRRDYRLLEDEAILQVRSDRQHDPALRPLRRRARRAVPELARPGRRGAGAALQAHHDDPAGRVFRHELAGGGGWGDPLERDPERGAARTCATSSISPAAARARLRRGGRHGALDGRRAATRRCAPSCARAAAWPAASGPARRRPRRPGGAGAMTGTRIGVDIGGTFTDIVLLRRRRHASTPRRSPRPSTTMRARSSTGSRQLFEEIGARGGRGRGGAPRHDRRLERDPRAQGRAHRPDHHQGLPRRARDPHAADAAALRHRPGRSRRPWSSAICASRSNERVDVQGRDPPAARPADAERAVARLLDEGVEAIAVCLLHCLRQPGARAADQGDRRAPGARPAALRSAPRCCRRSRSTSAPRPR